ncbi:MAG: hypothetical protein ACOYXB_09230 [Bacteroidota bacterium]
MDFDLGNILYILVTIVAIVAGIAGKKKKPAAPSGNSARPSAPAATFLEQLGVNLEDLGVEARRENVEETPVREEPSWIEMNRVEEEMEEQPETISESFVSAFSAYEGIYNPESESNKPLLEREGIRVTEPIEIIELDDDAPGVDPAMVGEHFDITRAIIYSEILRRREY